MNKNVQSLKYQQYNDLKVKCLFDHNPYHILDLSQKADLSQIHLAFRQKASILHDIELLRSEHSKELSSVWQGLVDAYNILVDHRRRAEYDNNHLVIDCYNDAESRRYHNQIDVSDVKNLLRNTPASSGRHLDLTFVAIVVSFLIAFETIFLIITAGDQRLSIYFLNAACLLFVASVEYFIWKKAASKPSDELDTIWYDFFLDPLGLKKEIQKKDISDWQEKDFEYIVLFNTMTYEDYQANTLPEDIKYYEIFKLTIETQYQSLKKEYERDSLNNHSFYKTHDLHKKYYNYLQNKENEYLIWGQLSKSDLNILLNNIPADFREKIKEALYRLYYYRKYKK